MQGDPLIWYFVVNPAAGNGKVARRWPAIEAGLQKAGIHFTYTFTEGPQHAIQLTIQAVEQGWRRFVAVGGDGTGNEVANGILTQQTCPPEDILFSILPIGTGNDWVRENKVPNNFRKWIEGLEQGRETRQDVGWVTYFDADGQEQRHYFINVMGMGFDGFVSVEAAKQGNKAASRLSYLLLVFKCLFRYRTPKLQIEFDGQRAEGHIYAVVIGINRYSGGGFQLVPHARPDDGQLALTIARRLGKLEMMLLTPLFFTGFIRWHPAIHLHQVRSLRAHHHPDTPVFFETDGEPLGHLPVEIGILERALRIHLPGKKLAAGIWPASSELPKRSE